MAKVLNAVGVVLVLVTPFVYFQEGVRIDEEQTSGNIFDLEVLIYPLLALVAFVAAALVGRRNSRHQ